MRRMKLTIKVERARHRRASAQVLAGRPACDGSSTCLVQDSLRQGPDEG